MEGTAILRAEATRPHTVSHNSGTWSLFMRFRGEMQAFIKAIEKIQRGDLTAPEAMDWAQDMAAR